MWIRPTSDSDLSYKSRYRKYVALDIFSRLQMSSMLSLPASPHQLAALQVNVNPPTTKSESWGIASLVIGLVALFAYCVPVIGLCIALLGVLLGLIGLITGAGIPYSIAGLVVSISILDINSVLILSPFVRLAG